MPRWFPNSWGEIVLNAIKSILHASHEGFGFLTELLKKGGWEERYKICQDASN